MKTRKLKLIPNFYGVVVLTASVFLTNANAQLFTFEPEAPRVWIDFENLDIDDPISTIGWTGTGNGNILGAEPRQPGINPSGVAIQADASTTRLSAASPAQTVTPAFTSNDTLYFSGWFNRTTSGNSGGAVLLNGSSSLGGFGIMDTGTNAFILYAQGERLTSSWTATANTWYEIALVIDLNPQDISLSLGYLFVRNVTAGESEFALVEDLAGISMGYTDVLNATHFTHFSTTAFRSSSQIDNLAAGIGTLTQIPELNSLSALGGMILLTSLLLSRMRSRLASENIR